MKTMTFSLDPVPPFRLDLTVWTLRRRPDNLVDRWDGQTYRRVLALEDEALELATTQFGASDAPHPRVTLRPVVSRSQGRKARGPGALRQAPLGEALPPGQTPTLMSARF